MSPQTALDIITLAFLFAFGACVGSFLNVVVYRMPRGLSLVRPRSRCPRCEHPLAWRDNLPILGWLILRGRCRYCLDPISARYPLVELFTAAMFVAYWVLFYKYQIGPCPDVGSMKLVWSRHWPLYLLYMGCLSGLLAASLIDAETFNIELNIPWLMAAAGVVVHALVDTPYLPGALNLLREGVPTAVSAMTAGAALGLFVSVALWRAGSLPASFADGDPALEADLEAWEREREAAEREGREPPPRPREFTAREIRGEMRKEMVFLMPPMLGAMIGAGLFMASPTFADFWRWLAGSNWLSGMLGAALGAMAGAYIVWLARILGTLAFGRVAMGMGDVHLMLGAGAVIGAGPSVVAFFLAPFAGLAVGAWLLLTGGKRELPYGPYLSIAVAATLLCYCPIAEVYFRPLEEAIGQMVQGIPR